MNILLNGINGRMGEQLRILAANNYKDAHIVGGVDIIPGNLDVPVFTNWDDVNIDCDCIVDFSNHKSVETMLPYAIKHNIPVVVATTGHTDEEKSLIKNAAKSIPVFYTANMSMGIALLAEAAVNIAKMMPDANIEIIEKHHNRKLDAPSGTALMLADEIKTVRKNAVYNIGRNGHAKRTDEEIGIHAIRMGNIVGEHEIIIGTDSQTITLKHEAHSRALFAEGGLTAAAFIIGQPIGLYDMKDMLNA